MDLPGLDLKAFRRWYDAERPDEIAGPLRARMIPGGKSNLTYEVTDGVSWWIVRRPPLGHVQDTAHDMRREYTVMTALAGTDVPVPETYALCSDPEVLGVRFYVMQHVAGTVYRDAAQLEELGPRPTAAMARQMVGVLARLHAVDPERVGLGAFGRPERFLARQIRRWGVQLAGSASRELPDADRLLSRLGDEIPDTDDGRASGLVHGDYRLDNLLMDLTAEQPVRAVVDWEMATLGDPLADVALMLVYDRLYQVAGGATIADYGAASGYPGAREQLEAYAEAGGRDLAPLGFHLGLAHLKLAVILEGIHYRHLRGQTLGQGFDQVGEAVRPLLAAGLAALDGRSG
ncbi:phosphotransferase family protein [Nonomuraea harbinensis]|uniref:Phosphotransferase family protein n=1 Tax=Nonomuraea harbinensis TaxID=1286938 RepID=A0ABW1BWY6_9ACTN|nr:phosphotransferase family protein [Nonomuraea harbinensis]